MATKFHELKIAELTKTTPECSLITFEVPGELREEFKFTQGQHLTLRTQIDGEDVRRSYSLCSCPLDNEWKVAVKKIEGGLFSSFANDELKAGDTLQVMPPAGRFNVPIDTERQRNFVAFAAGSGITPILSIISTHLHAEPKSTFTLFYVNRTVGSIILKEEIEGLKNLFLDRFEVYHFLTKQERDVPLFNGRIDEKKLEILSKTLLDMEGTDGFFLCGPEEMIFNIRDFLLAQNVDAKKIHFELFTTAAGEKRKKRPVAKTVSGDVKMCDVTIHEGGKTFNFKLPQGSDNILDAAVRQSADLPFACKGGVCATCRAKLLEGEVDMDLNYALEKDEVKAGYILTCQAVPKSDKVVVDFDG